MFTFPHALSRLTLSDLHRLEKAQRRTYKMALASAIEFEYVGCAHDADVRFALASRIAERLINTRMMIALRSWSLAV